MLKCCVIIWKLVCRFFVVMLGWYGWNISCMKNCLVCVLLNCCVFRMLLFWVVRWLEMVLMMLGWLG